MSTSRLYVSIPEELVDRPLVYELVKNFEVVPNIRRANVEEHTGWIVLELSGADGSIQAAVAHLTELGCSVNRMEGDVLEG
jgi:hypothetical protein